MYVKGEKWRALYNKQDWTDDCGKIPIPPAREWKHLIKNYCAGCNYKFVLSVHEERYKRQGNFCQRCIRDAEMKFSANEDFDFKEFFGKNLGLKDYATYTQKSAERDTSRPLL